MCMAGNPLNSEKCAADKPSDYDSSWTSRSCTDSSCSDSDGSGTETDGTGSGTETAKTDDKKEGLAQVEDENIDDVADQIGALPVDNIIPLMITGAQTEGWIDSLGTVWDKTAEAVSDAYDTAKEAASDAYDWTAEWAEEVANKLPQVEAESVYDDYLDCYNEMLC